MSQLETAPADDEVFRQDLRAWLESAYASFRPRLAGRGRSAQPGFPPRMGRHACANGWSGLGWPAEHGGRASRCRGRPSSTRSMRRAVARHWA